MSAMHAEKHRCSSVVWRHTGAYLTDIGVHVLMELMATWQVTTWDSSAVYKTRRTLPRGTSSNSAGCTLDTQGETAQHHRPWSPALVYRSPCIGDPLCPFRQNGGDPLLKDDTMACLCDSGNCSSASDVLTMLARYGRSRPTNAQTNNMGTGPGHEFTHDAIITRLS